MALNPFGITDVDPDIVKRFEQHLDASPAPDPAAEQPPKVAPPKLAPKAAKVEQAEEEAVAAATEEPEEEVEASGEETAAEDATEEPTIDTFADLASAFDIPEEDLLDHLQVDGVDGEKVSLRVALDGYRQGPSQDAVIVAEVERLTADRRKALEDGVASLAQATARILDRIESRKLPPQDLERIKAENPSQYIQIIDQYQADEMAARQAIERLNEATKQREAEMEAAHEKHVQEQARLLLKMKPEWRDEEAAKKATTEIHSYLREVGASEDDINGLVDARAIQTVWEAAQYRKLQKKKPAALKRLRGAPTRTALAAAARRDPAPNEAQDKLRAARISKLRNSGRAEDAAALISEMM